MKANFICLHLLFFQGILSGQVLKAQNLIPNNSFETYSICPQTTAHLYLATYWFQPRKNNNASVNQACSSEYFNSCTSAPIVSVPNNMFGFQNAKTGNAYIGFAAFDKFTPNYREYAQIGLSIALEEAKVYKLEFNASLADFCRFSIKQLEACFTNDSLFDSTAFAITSFVPQIQNNSFISDTMNWVKISGSFTANGGEKFLTIGNFHPDSLTDTLSVINNPLNYVNGAYYYIDDVSLTLDSSAGINELTNKNSYTVFPNPAIEYFKVFALDARNKQDEFVLYSTIGEAVMKKKITDREQVVLTEGLSSGIYYWRCGGNSGKLAIIKDK